MLTPKNRQAIDLYLSTDPECSGNGTRAWMRAYGTKNAASAATAWQRMLRNAEAQIYLHTRQTEIEEARRVQIAFDRDRYMVTLDRMLHVTSQRYVGEDGRLHIEDAAETRRIAKDLYAAETGNVFPFQQDNGVQVAININTQWRGDTGAEPIEVTETPEKPPESPDEPPRVVLIGKQ